MGDRIDKEADEYHLSVALWPEQGRSGEGHGVILYLYRDGNTEQVSTVGLWLRTRAGPR